jgi:hypothetical protein
MTTIGTDMEHLQANGSETGGGIDHSARGNQDLSWVDICPDSFSIVNGSTIMISTPRYLQPRSGECGYVLSG